MRKFNSIFSVFRRPANAVAFINGSEEYPDIKGLVFFYQMREGVMVRAEIFGLPKEAEVCDTPIFAFHIHSGSQCTGDENDFFADTKGHYNPKDCPHPYHAGDMPSLFSVNGKAVLAFLTDRFTVKEILEKAVVIHSSTDDFATQPSGNAGKKIACGVIKPTAR
ncbi:MAG: superoxide dismutase family protein [Ruminococcaceae bacterium]|nr:superoxide dismutase family protein [Oscillospiraceae bacterium]